MLRPIGARVLLKKIHPKKDSPIIIPKNLNKDVYVMAEVVAVGDGAYLESGEKVPVAVRPGDKVVVPSKVGYTLEEDDQEYIMINERDIVAVIEE